jgi:hypothetical protein
MEELERLYRERYFGFRNALATVTGSYDSARDAVQEGFARGARQQAPVQGRVARGLGLEDCVPRCARESVGVTGHFARPSRSRSGARRGPPPPAQDPEDIVCLVGVVEYRGFDAGGKLVERYRVPKPRWTRPIEPFREALSIRLFSGRQARLEYARAERGRMCWRVFWGDMAGGGCSIVPKRSLPSATVIGSGENQSVYFSGPVGSDIARVELVWDDGSSEPMQVENGFALKQIDPHGKRFPTKLVGRDEAGRVVVERSAFGPG